MRRADGSQWSPGQDLDAIDERGRALHVPDDAEDLPKAVELARQLHERVAAIFGGNSPEAYSVEGAWLMLRHDLAVMSGPVPYLVEALPEDQAS
jgi:hypothetical protein